MSERSHTVPTPEGEYFESNRFAGLSSLLGLIAIVALALCVVGAFLNPHQFSYSWLFAFAFFFTLCAGCFFWTIVHHATDANWSVVVRRQLENIAVLLVVLAILFVPILLLRRHLYSWMDIPPGVEHALDAKRAYLNWSFFLIRAVVFLGFFLVRVARFAPLIGETGQGWKSTVHHLNAEGRVYQSANVRALSHLWRVRLADESELSLVLHDVWRVHLRGRGRELDVAACPGHHSLATGWIFEGHHHARALPHHGKMDAGLLHFLGLHRVRSVHAHLVCEHTGGDAIFYHPKH